MATDQRNLPAFFSTDADFRAWGGGIAAQLVAMGLVKTADTGQIDWATVLKPTVVSTYGGYEIWRFADALQATKPVFIKIEYGVAAAVDRPALRVTVSTATNGAGTPSGQVGVIRVHPAGASKTAGIQLPSYCSGGPSRLNLANNLDATNPVFLLNVFVERTKTAAGTETGDGIVAWSLAGTNGYFQVIPFSGSVPAHATSNMSLALLGGLSTVGVDVALSPTVAFLGKPLFASWLSYIHADIGELTPFPLTHLGALRTYLPIGDGITGTPTAQGGTSAHSIAMLWE